MVWSFISAQAKAAYLCIGDSDEKECSEILERHMST